MTTTTPTRTFFRVLKDPQLNNFLEALCHPEFIAGDLLAEKKVDYQNELYKNAGSCLPHVKNKIQEPVRIVYYQQQQQLLIIRWKTFWNVLRYASIER